jgi:hypothetical protein
VKNHLGKSLLPWYLSKESSSVLGAVVLQLPCELELSGEVVKNTTVVTPVILPSQEAEIRRIVV